MFIDYYEVLELNFGASESEIKSAYRRLAIKWHPDKNPDVDTLRKMQSITEAYLILKDTEGKIRYDEEYRMYKSFIQILSENSKDSEFSFKNKEYKFNDEILNKWMNNARRQANDLVQSSLKEFKTGLNAAGSEMIKSTIGFLLIGVLFSIIFILTKSCNN